MEKSETKAETKISVVLPTYNRCELLKKALDSAVNQTYINLEILVADNHSDDGTEELCREYAAKDSRIKYFRQDENIGMVANANFIVSKVTGDYWLGMCDDDWIDLDYIEKMMDFALKNPNYTAVFSLTKLYNPNGELIATAKTRKLDYKNVNKRVKKLISINLENLCIGFYKSSVLKQMEESDGGMYKSRLAEDWLMTFKHLVAGKGKILDNVYYHKILDGITKDLEATKKLWGIDDLNENNYWNKLGLTLSDAILKDKFFELYLDEKQRKELAKTAYSAALSYESKKIKTYIKRHPLFFFRKKFWTLLQTNLKGI